MTISCCQPKTHLRATWNWETMCCPSSAKACRPSLWKNCTGDSLRKWWRSPRKSWKLTRWHTKANYQWFVLVLCTKLPSFIFLSFVRPWGLHAQSNRLKCWKPTIGEDFSAFSDITQIFNIKQNGHAGAAGTTLQLQPNMKLNIHLRRKPAWLGGRMYLHIFISLTSPSPKLGCFSWMLVDFSLYSWNSSPVNCV